MDGSVFTRMVDMYKSIVVFMLTGGKTVLVPMFYENYFLATLRLLEKLHKVSTNDTSLFSAVLVRQSNPRRKCLCHGQMVLSNL